MIMPFSFLAREAGRVHVCGHRGYSLRYPENTLPALAAAKACGATTIEIDIVLTADDEPILLHDRTLDRTTDGHGFAADFALEQIRSLDAGARFNPRFAGTRVPTLAEVVDWAAAEEMGIFLGRTSPSIEWWRCSKQEAEPTEQSSSASTTSC
jgi:glycerophosphoryl diester phosphodiesterase